MAEVWLFLIACWNSGTLLRSVCALVIIPSAAWLTIRLLTPAIADTSDDPGWQAPLAAAAASIPGALLVLLATAAFIAGADASCRESAIGQALFGIIVSISVLAFVRATIVTVRRMREADQLVRASAPATGRLALIATKVGVRTRLLEDEAFVCVLARIWRPVVVVSSGALELNDLELAAALHHERGHARRGDQLIAALLSFLVDLLPLPSMDLVRTYRRARELAADAHALAAVEPHDLASALLRFAKPSYAVPGTAALGGDSTVRARLRALLRDVPLQQASVLKRAFLIAALVAVFVTGIAPAASTLLHPAPCIMSADAGRARGRA